MKERLLRRIASVPVVLLAVLSTGLGTSAAQAGVFGAAAAAVPAPPGDEELHANSNSSITITWPASLGATSYNIYRSTTSGAEGNTPIATTTNTTYTDLNLSSTPIYFYQISAVNASGESARTAEDASKTPPPLSTAGDIPGVTSGNGKVYYCKDAQLAGFDWFQTLTGWFPQVLGSSGSTSPGARVVDMAYSTDGSMTFNNVVVPTSGLYTVDWRYAFQGGLFPGVNNRQMGLAVNGTVITTTQRFPITGSFETYQHSALQVHLNAGVNSISQLAVTDHGLSRVDQMTVTPATSSVPSGPTNLTVVPGNAGAKLSWTASASGNPTSYTIYRGTKSDGEANVAIGTTNGTTTTFTDSGLHNGTTYFYNVAATNSTGISPDSNEVSTTPTASTSDTTAPSVPTGLTASGTTSTSTNLSWGASTDNVGVTGYDVIQNGTKVATVTGTNYTAGGLTPLTQYSFQVMARDAAGNLSAASGAVSVLTLVGGGTNIALGRPTTASSIENAGTAAAKATDGSGVTRWSSAFSDPQWLQVDLGAVRAVHSASLQWETAYAKAYQIQVSDDGLTWNTIYSTTTGAGGTETLNFAGTGRYIRLYGTQRATQYGYSLWEFQVFG
jgi:chitodextrinase